MFHLAVFKVTICLENVEISGVSGKTGHAKLSVIY